jgi:hypothetical protein
MSDLITLPRAAVQQALEALEAGPDVDPIFAGETEVALRAALEQPEQEPVDIKPPNPEGATQCIVRWWAETPAGWVGAWDREALEQFTHPPRREWRSLSEEEILPRYLGRMLYSHAEMLEFFRAVEAALRSKNHE